MIVPTLERHCGSWMIVRKDTGEVVCEVFDRRSIEALSYEGIYTAVTASEWLCALNRSLECGQQ